ncbi:porin family protein [Bradyrhizobium sp. WSM 1704]|uniref:outer membrane protein n=1 Tax=Bradyrhizobium semiaridum TaxID=2821404 RepID=UPI001CE3A646|nr:outer membrane beta-barrel protein [Bradyrhizobium semiaridum]MCA6125996.1 porin family protein [Bradyrhizobium semiaridum]
MKTGHNDKTIAAAALLVALSATAASAADLPVYTKAPPPPAPVVSPAVNWSGFYIGGFGGYGWSNEVHASATGVGGIDFSTDEVKGGFGGGTLGYNWQAPGSTFVGGIEVDAAGSGIQYTLAGIGKDELNAFGSVTGRLGLAYNAALFYVKGGYAWANNKATVLGVSESNLHSGWTVGGGFEYMFAPSWSGKVEYMYADYAKETYFASVVPPGADVGASFHTVKAGINYHFNWGGPVVAKY